MTYKPDYGLHLLNSGVSRKVDLNFYEFRLSSLTVLAPGQYSTMVEQPINGEMYALSLDFDRGQLDEILSRSPDSISMFLKTELANDPTTPRTIDFEGDVVFGVKACLGEVQQVENERFVPLVMKEIM